MKRILSASLAGASVLLLSLTAAAQDEDNLFHHERDAYFHGEHWHAHLFQRVKQDVEHVRASAWPRGGDHYRLDRTIAELDELQSKFAHHVYDDSELQRVIDTLGRVASYNRMPPREREIIQDDVDRLREYREHHADWFLEHER